MIRIEKPNGDVMELERYGTYWDIELYDDNGNNCRMKLTDQDIAYIRAELIKIGAIDECG